MSTTEPAQFIDLVYIGQRQPKDAWLVSDWSAGQTKIMEWSPDNVVPMAGGGLQFMLSSAPEGSAQPYLGGEIQSGEAASTGTWSWTAQAPKMVDGAVFGMFTYKEDWQNDPWIEFDFEFVGADTTQVQLNIHMEDASGRHITLAQTFGGPVIVDLGFDAAQGLHTYEVTVTDTEAIFLVDDKVVGRFSGADMPGGVWASGAMKSFVDLWAVDPGGERWAGDWAYPGEPLVATVTAIDVRPGDSVDLALVPSDTSIKGNGEGNVLFGTSFNDIIDGRGGNDVLSGSHGDDQLHGGRGRDVLSLEVGDDLLDGGAGTDLVKVSGAGAASIDLSMTGPQGTGYGTETLLNIENATGGSGDDQLIGSAGSNVLDGNAGADVLYGGGGTDLLRGGLGDDVLWGGEGQDRIQGSGGHDTLLLDGGDDMLDGGAGKDWIRVSGSAAVTINLAKVTAQATGYGLDSILNVENVEGSSAANKFHGHDGGNILIGNGGSDLLYGRGGADRLVGGAGQDTLFGGRDGSRDVFVFNAPHESVVGTKRDVIHDYVSGVDDLDLSGIDVRPGLSGDQAFQFNGTTAMAYSVWYGVSRSEVIVRADVTGDKTADIEIRLAGATSLTASDFLL